MKKILILVAALAISFSLQAQQTDLKLNLEVGKIYKQNSVSTTNMAQEMSGMNFNIDMKFSSLVSFKVLGIENDEYKLEIKTDSTRMEVKSPFFNLNASTGNPEAKDYLSMFLKKYSEKAFVVKMTKYGQVTQVENFDEMFKSIFDDLSKMDLGAGPMPQIKSQLEQSYGKDAFKNNVLSQFAFYPTKKVGVGDKWVTSSVLNSGVLINTDTEYELINIDSNTATIKGISSSKIAEGNKVKEVNGQKMNIEMSGKVLSEIKIDRKSGWVIESKQKQEIITNSTAKKEDTGEEMKFSSKTVGETITSNK